MSEVQTESGIFVPPGSAAAAGVKQKMQDGYSAVVIDGKVIPVPWVDVLHMNPNIVETIARRTAGMLAQLLLLGFNALDQQQAAVQKAAEGTKEGVSGNAEGTSSNESTEGSATP